jgi:hypothetical protein
VGRKERGGGKGGEMTQTLYAHMNKRYLKSKQFKIIFLMMLSRCIAFIITKLFMYTVENFENKNN